MAYKKNSDSKEVYWKMAGGNTEGENLKNNKTNGKISALLSAIICVAGLIGLTSSIILAVMGTAFTAGVAFVFVLGIIGSLGGGAALSYFIKQMVEDKKAENEDFVAVEAQQTFDEKEENVCKQVNDTKECNENEKKESEMFM